MYAVIMAGGGGTRLWPLSRERRPKPFLPLLEGGRCLLEATVSRLGPLIQAHDVHVVTDARYADLVREVAPGIPAANIIGEPVGRNTAAAVALASEAIERPDDEVMVVLPPDQAIRDAAGFRAALVAAAERAASGAMVTLGIAPTEPSTGYGYVVASGAAQVHAGRETYAVARFEEKPTPDRARRLIASGAAYWNAGTFVWRRGAVRDGLARHAPDISGPIHEWMAGAKGPGQPKGRGEAGWPGSALAATYAALRATSIDYALLEPASLEGQVAVVPAAIGWSDLGSWSALRSYLADSGAPLITAEAPAEVIAIGSSNVLVHAQGARTVALVGLDDLVVIDTPEALLISSIEAAQDVKQVVDQLRSEGRHDLL